MAISNEQDKGNPPPKISSSDGIPVDMMVVEDDEGDVRVPGRRTVCLPAALRLKEDMLEEGAITVGEMCSSTTANSGDRSGSYLSRQCKLYILVYPCVTTTPRKQYEQT